MLKRLLITLFLCFSSFLTFAQTDEELADEGSTYSQFGIGFPVDYGSSAADGLGILGVSYTEPGVAGIANPAHWGSTVYGMATGGIGVSNFNASDNFGSARNSLFYIDQFQLQLPIYKNKLGISASFSPYTRTAFQVTETGTRVIGSGAAQRTLNFQSQNTGSGGINRIEIGLGWNINSNIAVGYAPSLIFASIDNEYQTFFDTDDDPNNSNPYSPIRFTEQTSASGFGNRLGVFVTLPTVIKEDDRLNIGATVNFPVELNGERVQENDFASDDSDGGTVEDLTVAEGNIQLPFGFATGITYKPGDKMTFAAEALFQKWSNYENELKAANNGVFVDRFKVGGGVSYFPFVTGSDKFLSRFKYRLGFSYDTGHLELSGQNIDTIMLSAGLGLLSPSSQSNSSIDLSFEYGIRGTKNQDLVKENIWGFKLSLNLAEIFFFRPKLQ